MKSQPISFTSSGACPTDCAASITVRAPTFFAAPAKFRDGSDVAERVRNMREREDLDLRREQAIERVEIQRLGIRADKRHVLQRRAARLRSLLPRDEVRVMLDLGAENDITGFQLRAEAARDDVDALGGPAREDHFRGVGGADEFRDPRARALVCIGRAHREGVQSAMHVRVVAFVVTHERIDHRARFLRGSRRCRGKRAASHLPAGAGWGSRRGRLSRWAAGCSWSWAAHGVES